MNPHLQNQSEPGLDTSGIVYRLTFFDDETAQEAIEYDCTAHDLAELIITTRADCKEKLPFLKLARFGDKRTDKNSLRHNSNVVCDHRDRDRL